MRFYWKQQSNSAGTKAGKAKILRNVQFPKVLDLFEFCSDELKKGLDLGREYERKMRKEEDEKRLAGKTAAELDKKDEDVEMKDEEVKNDG